MGVVRTITQGATPLGGWGQAPENCEKWILYNKIFCILNSLNPLPVSAPDLLFTNIMGHVNVYNNCITCSPENYEKVATLWTEVSGRYRKPESENGIRNPETRNRNLDKVQRGKYFNNKE